MHLPPAFRVVPTPNADPDPDALDSLHRPNNSYSGPPAIPAAAALNKSLTYAYAGAPLSLFCARRLSAAQPENLLRSHAIHRSCASSFLGLLSHSFPFARPMLPTHRKGILLVLFILPMICTLLATSPARARPSFPPSFLFLPSCYPAEYAQCTCRAPPPVRATEVHAFACPPILTIRIQS
ncbi:hypothetical protein C8R44DRAFT_886377 [Mycena epipterygia]|nr:hypothetical protein C8R44DRAFT_886377 [Mycena epipterygia]